MGASESVEPTVLRWVSLSQLVTSTHARECRLRGTTAALRPLSLMSWQLQRLSERSAVSLVSPYSPLSLKRPPSKLKVRRCFRFLCT